MPSKPSVRREYYELNRVSIIAKERARKAARPEVYRQIVYRRREILGGYEARLQSRVNVCARKGLEYWPKGCRVTLSDPRMDRLVDLNARQAWDWWIRVRAPNSWMRSYYRATPWLNPRLSQADKWRIRYWTDPAFRARELEKVQTLKAARAVRIEARSDGTLTGEVIVALYGAARVCPYCDKPMRSPQKSLDHVVALSKGGMHSITNVVVCCKTCNTRKAAQAIHVWQQSCVDKPYRLVAS